MLAAIAAVDDVTLPDDFSGLRAFEQHMRLLITSYRDRIREDEAFSHLSAALVWELPLVRADLPARVEVIRNRSIRTYKDIRYHRRVVDPAKVVSNNGLFRRTDLPTTLLDVARAYPLDVSVPMIDHALRGGTVDRAHLLEEAAKTSRGHHRTRMLTAVELSSPVRESPAESVCAVRFYEHGIMGMVEQRELYDAGEFIARPDFLDEESGTVVEVDGSQKYGPTDEERRKSFDAERARDYRIKNALGLDIIHIRWQDLWRPDVFLRIKGRQLAHRKRGLT